MSNVEAFKEFLIEKALDPESGCSTSERALYALLSTPLRGQAACSKDELNTVVETVRGAMDAAVSAALRAASH